MVTELKTANADGKLSGAEIKRITGKAVEQNSGKASAPAPSCSKCHGGRNALIIGVANLGLSE
jgi:hypothetical protein